MALTLQRQTDRQNYTLIAFLYSVSSKGADQYGLPLLFFYVLKIPQKGGDI